MFSRRSSHSADVELLQLPDAWLQQNREGASTHTEPSSSSVVSSLQSQDQISSSNMIQRSQMFSNNTPSPSICAREVEEVTSADADTSACLHPQADCTQKAWTPKILGRYSLYSFVTGYVAIMVALVVCLITDDRFVGLATVQIGWHYAWTYGPTLVLSVAAAFWELADLRVRQLMPWAILNQGPSLASETLLLDYVSQMQLITPWYAWKAKHWPVLVSSCSSWILKLLIVLSTGLFFSQTEVVTIEGVELQSRSRFEVASWNITSNDTSAATRLDLLVPSTPGLASIAPIPLPYSELPTIRGTVTYGPESMYKPTASSTSTLRQRQRDLATDNSDPATDNYDPRDPYFVVDGNAMPALFALGITMLNMSYPIGTSRDSVIAAYLLSEEVDGSVNATITVRVDAYHGELICERGQLWIRDCEDSWCFFEWSDEAWPLLRITSPTCHVDDVPWPDINHASYGSNEINIGFLSYVTCDQPLDGSAKRIIVGTGRALLANNGGQFRLADNMTLWTCEPRDHFGPALATIDTSGTLLSVSRPDPSMAVEKSLPGFTNWTIAGRVLETVRNTGVKNGGLWTKFNDTLIGCSPLDRPDHTLHGIDCGFDEFFQIYLAAQRPRTTKDLFDSSEHLLAHIQDLYSLIASQVVFDRLLVPANDSHLGNLTTASLRLRVRGPSMYGMLACLGALSLLTCILEIIGPHSVVSRDPGSIAGLSVLLARSSKLVDLLAHTGHTSRLKLASMLEGYLCHRTMLNTSPRDGYVIDIAPDASLTTSHEGTGLTVSEDEKVWWRPTGLTPWLKITFIVALIVLVTSLELVYRQSQTHQGLADVDETTYVRYIWRLIPGTVMLVVSMMVNMMASNSKAFLPYHDLRHWPCAGRTTSTILDNAVYHIPLMSFHRALRHRHWAILATTSAALLAFPLTIISSGLYTIKAFDAFEAVNFRLEKGLLMSDIHIDSRMASLSMAMVRHRGATDQPWTYHDLVFPQLQLESNDSPLLISNFGQSTFDSEFNVNIPAWSAYLDWERLEKTAFDVYSRPLSRESNISTTYVSMKLPQRCNATMMEIEHGSRWSTSVQNRFVTTHTKQFAFADCPYLLFFNGVSDAVSGEHLTGKTDIESILACYARPRLMLYNVTLENPSLRILSASLDGSSEPIDMPETSHLNSAFNNIQGVLEELYPLGGQNDIQNDGYLAALLYELGTSSPPDLFVPENLQVVNDTLSKLWSTTFAHVINQAARTEVTEGTGLPLTFPGTLRQRNRTRLVQNAVSTHLLAGLLGSIAVCIFLSFWSMSTHEVLPKDPGSILAAASLLADSELLMDQLSAPDLAWCNDKTLKELGVLDGLLFSMGWWGDPGSERFGIDVGRARWSR